MKPVALMLVLVGVSTCKLFAAGETFDTGRWPESWPRELEPLRKQSKTMVGGVAMLSRHEIRFSSREQFEAAWPHLLRIKSSGAPIVLFRGPSKQSGCEVRIHCPPLGSAKTHAPVKPIVSAKDTRTRWLHATYIELYVDGRIVDLNRIELPSETPVVDKRFSKRESPSRSQSQIEASSASPEVPASS